MDLEYYDKLTYGGFKVVKNLTENEIPKSLLYRYQNLPTDYLVFLKNFESIINEDMTAWFISSNDFNGKTDNEFKWNEFELLSLEWSEDDNDELKAISQFWKNHVPIVMSVKSGYRFLAICLEKNRYGQIVQGQEPVFEEVTKVCDNFNTLIDLFKKKKIPNFV